MLFGQLLEVLRCRFQRLKKALRRAAVFSLPRWGLEPNIAFGLSPLKYVGVSYTVLPSSPHLHPPCSALCEFAEHEGWELINFR